MKNSCLLLINWREKMQEFFLHQRKEKLFLCSVLLVEVDALKSPRLALKPRSRPLWMSSYLVGSNIEVYSRRKTFSEILKSLCV